MDPWILLRPIVMATLFVVSKVGWKTVILGWVATTLAVLVYGCHEAG